MAGGPANLQEFLDLVRKSGVVEEKRLDAHVQKLSAAGLLPPEPSKVAGVLIRDGFLTHFQADNIYKGSGGALPSANTRSSNASVRAAWVKFTYANIN